MTLQGKLLTTVLGVCLLSIVIFVFSGNNNSGGQNKKNVYFDMNSFSNIEEGGHASIVTHIDEGMKIMTNPTGLGASAYQAIASLDVAGAETIKINAKARTLSGPGCGFGLVAPNIGWVGHDNFTPAHEDITLTYNIPPGVTSLDLVYDSFSDKPAEIVVRSIAYELAYKP